MTMKPMGIALALAWAMACGTPAGAQPAVAGRGLLHHIDELRVAYQRMPEEDLRKLALACSDEGTRQLMTLDDGAACSLAWDVLKARAFDGDFEAMLRWWRQQRTG